MKEIYDETGRTFKTLRVSLINTCNLACVYCTCSNDDSRQNYLHEKDQALPANELLKLIQQLHRKLNLDTVRFTGGEPLLYKQLPELVKGVSRLGIKNLKLTTNGLLLERSMPSLKAAGISSVNVSLDAVDPGIFYSMSRRSDPERVIKGIEAAKASGVEVKINSVMMKGINTCQIIPLLTFAFQKGIIIRFLEIMRMGHLYKKADQYLFSKQDMLDLISRHYQFTLLPAKPSSTARYWQTKEGNQFGIIANESEPFCSGCNRLRLDASGNIYGCLSSNTPVSIKDAETPEELAAKLKKALAQKQSLKFTGSELSMLHIGG